jgi:hypothetical protein
MTPPTWTTYHRATGQLLGAHACVHGYEARVRAALVWGVSVDDVGARKDER